MSSAPIRFVNVSKRARDSEDGLLVLAAGYPRCATSSLQLAFDTTLGLGPCMHMEHVIPIKSRIRLAAKLLVEEDETKRREGLHQLYDGFKSSTDYPGCLYTDDLIDMYPGVKVVLNKRKTPEAWLKSFHATIGFFATRTFAVTTWLQPTDYWLHYNYVNCAKLAKRRFGLSDLWSIEAYNAHNEWVHKVCKDKGVELLEWEPTDGWEPICKFLGVPIPEQDFPHVNDTATMKMVHKILVARGLLTWAAAFAVPIVAWWATKWLPAGGFRSLLGI
jgi:hypothetical protein